MGVWGVCGGWWFLGGSRVGGVGSWVVFVGVVGGREGV